MAIYTPEEHLERVLQFAPDFYEDYRAALLRTKSVDKPKWKRHNGELVQICDMNNYHLSAAANRVHQETVSRMEDVTSEKEYRKLIDPIFSYLKQEMETRGMTAPRIAD